MEIIKYLFGLFAGFLLGWMITKKKAQKVIIKNKTGKEVVDQKAGKKIDDETDDEAVDRFKGLI